ncbi:MAG: hypothetical protein KIG63_09980 [Methanobrevibacter sp.]|nr:hypothetical protein [Methanobrevibacter sp.]MCI5665423.1 hypothetical protein [Spirochaetia bacterium]MDD7768568.1 hypothetical protein [Treponema sp.]MDY3131846.1 hypothetical protein [Treponema sp.]
MTKDDFYFKIQVKQTMEFKYNSILYNINYDKTSDGKEIILFGRLYEEQKFHSYGDLMNNAKVENHFLKDMLEILDL